MMHCNAPMLPLWDRAAGKIQLGWLCRCCCAEVPISSQNAKPSPQDARRRARSAPGVSEGQQRSRRVSGQRGGSPLEQDLATEIAKEGLPDPDTEYRFSAARKWRFDFAWPRHRVACEVEGGLYDRSRHTTLAGYSNDCEKYNEAALRGWRVLRATAPMIKDGTILRQLRAALSSGSEFSGRE